MRSERTTLWKKLIRTVHLTVDIGRYYEYHRKRLGTSMNARPIELTNSGSIQAAARLKPEF